MSQYIHIKGAREHNLKNLDVVLPRDRLVVVTGLSGSGKSSLSFDTIYAEGAAAVRGVRCRLTRASSWNRWASPTWIPSRASRPAISIEQKSTSHNPPVHGRHGDGDL